MKDKENQFTKGNIYRFDYLSRTGRFHYQNVTFVRYVGPFQYSYQMGSDTPSGTYEFVDEDNAPTSFAPWMANEKTQEVEAFGTNERNFVRQDW